MVIEPEVDKNDELTRIANSFESTLNMHGHSFHQAVLRRQEELKNKTRKSNWNLFGMEVPVVCKNETTHIDIVNEDRSRSRSGNRDYYLVGECKRVNPAKGHWCFSNSKYSWRNHDSPLAQFDMVTCFSELPQYNATTKSRHTERGVYNLGLEVKTGEIGDSIGHKPQAINTSIGQVLKGASGFINYLCDETRSPILTVDRPAIIIPVIFTTARLFTTSIDLGEAKLEDGLLPKGLVTVEEVDWLWFNENRSPHLSHNIRFDARVIDSSEAYLNEQFRDFTRTIAIVSSSGIDHFLSFDMNEWFF